MFTWGTSASQGTGKEALVNPEAAIVFLQQCCNLPFKKFLTESFGHKAEHGDVKDICQLQLSKMFLYSYSQTQLSAHPLREIPSFILEAATFYCWAIPNMIFFKALGIPWKVRCSLISSSASNLVLSLPDLPNYMLQEQKEQTNLKYLPTYPVCSVGKGKCLQP